jgi:hypothetical protein
MSQEISDLVKEDMKKKLEMENVKALNIELKMYESRQETLELQKAEMKKELELAMGNVELQTVTWKRPNRDKKQRNCIKQRWRKY